MSTQPLKSLQRLLECLHSRDEGATAVEYALMVTLIAAVIFPAVALVGPALADIFSNVDLLAALTP